MPYRVTLLTIICLLFFRSVCIAQKSLRISFSRFGQPKVREVSIGENFQYKLKGSFRFKKGQLTALNDSLMVLNNSHQAIALSQLKALRIQKHKYHLNLFQGVFLAGAIGYPLLVGLNYYIVPDSEGLTAQTALVSGSFLLAAGLMHELNLYRVRITRRKQVSVLTRDYQNLSDSTKNN